MSKRGNKDIDQSSKLISGLDTYQSNAVSSLSKADTEQLPDLGLENRQLREPEFPKPSLKQNKRTGSRTARNSKAKKTNLLEESCKSEDEELERMLREVDLMLTEMTQSKWLSTEWPSLDIDFNPVKKSLES